MGSSHLNAVPSVGTCWLTAGQLRSLSLFTCSKVCNLMWETSSLYMKQTDFFRSIIYKFTSPASACVGLLHFLTAQALRDFLSCSFALFQSRKLLSSYIQERWHSHRPNSCHQSGREPHTHTHTLALTC